MTMIEYFWAEGDPEATQEMLLRLADSYEDASKPMLAAKHIGIDNVATRFKTGTDPSGTAWEPWAESYAPFALSHSTGPILAGRANLHLTGELYGAITDESAWISTPREVILDTATLPPYWAWNNFGADRQQPVQGMGSSEARASNRAFRARAKQAGLSVVKGPGENELPARPFVGFSKVARAKLDAMFTAWFEGEVTVAVSTKGKYFFRRKPGRATV
jgi:hypothetical protein